MASFYIKRNTEINGLIVYPSLSYFWSMVPFCTQWKHGVKIGKNQGVKIGNIDQKWDNNDLRSVVRPAVLSSTLRFSDVFRGLRKCALGKNGFIKICSKINYDMRSEARPDFLSSTGLPRNPRKNALPVYLYYD